MSSSLGYQIIHCPVCQGDARLSTGCARCGGAGVSLLTDEGESFMWRAELNQTTFEERRAKRKTRLLFHAVLLGTIFLLLLGFVLGLALDQTAVGGLLGFIGRVLQPSTWVAGHWSFLFFWSAAVLTSFLFFHARRFHDHARTLPDWGVAAHKKHTPRQGAFVDISPYFHHGVWDLLEQAYQFTVRMGESEVRPIHLVSAMLATTTGGIFLTRLGMDFEKTKPGLIELLRRGAVGSPTSFSAEVKRVLVEAYADASLAKRKHVTVIEVFMQAFGQDESLQKLWDMAGFPAEQVRHVGEWIQYQDRLQEERERFIMLASLKPKTTMNRAMTAQGTPYLDQLSEDLTLMARGGYIGPVVVRDQEMEELLRIIESGDRSVILVGDPGTGKTAMIEDLARRMVEEDVPEALFDRRLVSVHVPQLMSSGDAREVSERFLDILQEIGASGNIILVLQGLEMLVGGAQGPLDLAEVLASELDRGYFTMIATTTPRAWTAYLERRTIGSKLARINVPEMSIEETIRVLMLQSGYIEYQNQVFFSYAALERAAALCGRYIRDVRLPESAVSIMREAAVMVRHEQGEHAFVTGEDIARVIHQKTDIPVETVSRNESQKLLSLEDHLHKRVIGQDEAVKAVAQAMRRARAEIRSVKRPIANFLFLGPTGVGKTELAKALASEYFGSERSMVRLDMSEYQSEDSLYRLIGASGDERGGFLTEAVRKQPFTLVLLDELEKAHPDILTLFLQVMDDGRLTDGVGRTVDFTNVVLIATSNAGTSFIQDQVKAGTALEQIKTALLEQELRGIFQPEFLNRFDGVIVFKPLTIDEVTQIAWLMVNELANRLKEKGIEFKADDEAVEKLAIAGFDPLFGARPLRRVVQDKLENGLADLLLRESLGRGDTVVYGSNGELTTEKATF